MKKMYYIMTLMFSINIFIYLSCSVSSGSYAYAEKYEIQCEEKDLINAIEKFKSENPDFIVPSQLQIKDGRRNENDYWYHIYFYYKNEGQLVKTWVRKENKGKTTFAFVAINDGFSLGNWKFINKDFSSDDNKIQKDKFEGLILNKIKNQIHLK